MKASIVLPAYNEAENIAEVVQAVFKHQPQGWEYEVIVVDDNSPDKTYEKVKTAFAGDARVRPILRTHDRGLAKSIRAGFEAATGDWLITMDSDLTHDPAEIPKMLVIGQIYDVVSGSRFCPGGNMDSRLHYYFSLIFNWFTRAVLNTQIQDNFGGFFVIRKDKLRQLPLDEIFSGYGDYFFRLLHHAQLRDMSVLEIPAFYHERRKGSSKSHFFWLLFQYASAVLSFRLGILLSRGRSFKDASSRQA